MLQQKPQVVDGAAAAAAAEDDVGSSTLEALQLGSFLPISPPHQTMKQGTFLLVLAAILVFSGPPAAATGAAPRPPSNITVIGTVFCDICSNNTFSNNSYFLRGAKVRVECSFKSNSTAKEEITISVERTTDRFGVYRVDVPPVDGFECREGREIESFCRASLVTSSSALCSVPGLSISTEHVAIRCTDSNLCVYNLNALNYRPAKRDLALCGASPAAGTGEALSKSLDSALFFWPPFPPFGFPWPFPHWPPFPFPFPFPSPSSSFPFPFTPPPTFPFPFPFPSPPPSFPFPFPFPSPPPSFPFPFPSPPPSFPIPFVPSPSPPAFPFPLPPSWFPTSPPPPAFPFPLPPSLFPRPPPPPPSFPFPFPPLPPLSPAPFVFTPSPPPPSPPPPAFPFPFPPFPPNPFAPAPPPPSPPPPPQFSWRDPRTWFFPPRPPSSPHSEPSHHLP